MNAIILGKNSGIAVPLMGLLIGQGWKVEGWARGDLIPEIRFDLCVICMGRIAPVGLWHEINGATWEQAMESNLLAPLRLLRMIWPQHNPRAAVCFMAGSNPQMIMDGYSAYNTSKMALLKLVEQLDHETPDARFFALGPGIVLTKIHEQSKGWPNPKLAAAREKKQSTSAQRIFDCLMWALKQEKAVIGGRNICVSDPWDKGALEQKLKRDQAMYKLRRVE